MGGHFQCSANNLTSLVGAPLSVGGGFDCQDNPLISLEGAPLKLKGTFACDYSHNLPLLRLLNYKKIIIQNGPEQLIKIIKPYLGQGKPGAIKAAVELIRAGYKENARW